jgi:hypothetical protein
VLTRDFGTKGNSLRGNPPSFQKNLDAVIPAGLLVK